MNKEHCRNLPTPKQGDLEESAGSYQPLLQSPVKQGVLTVESRSPQLSLLLCPQGQALCTGKSGYCGSWGWGRFTAALTLCYILRAHIRGIY